MTRQLIRTLLWAAPAVLLFADFAAAQGLGRPPRGPGGDRGGPPGMQQRTPATEESFVKRMLTLDADGDETLSKSEVTDARLFPLLTRADADGNGKVTKAELSALYAKEAATLQQSRGRGGPGMGGPGGPPPGGMRRPGN
ncbi:MAG: hypothetical protein QM775_29870 [Pirellulales bacterium]